MTGLLLACVLLLGTTFVAGTCPIQQTIDPCSCSLIKDGISLECKGPENSKRILSVIHDMESSQNLELVLESLTLPVLPQSVRKASALRLYDINVERISGNSSAVWPKLNDMVIESSTMVEKPWPYLKGATSLRHLKVSNIAIPRIGSEFRDGVPAGIGYLDIRRTRTTTFESNSMSHLRNLKYLLMVDIPLQTFCRNVLPLEMPDLHTFILGNTQIEKLEAGFFEGMPKLEVLMLNGNKFTTLDSHLFAPVDKHLTHLLAERNPLICDCNLVWLTKNMQRKGSMKVLATCTDHDTHERKEVTNLDENQYCS